MKSYEVTEKAGQWVAGQRVNKGNILRLTQRQAEYELRLGTIREVKVFKEEKKGRE